mmetsp:Transcript_7178/g.15619  ORF Transcript_7178/g.15619 Transcript_7178/m.15619 type:complete len:299 (-) Transcript_7178:802-1698(-)
MAAANVEDMTRSGTWKGICLRSSWKDQPLSRPPVQAAANQHPSAPVPRSRWMVPPARGLPTTARSSVSVTNKSARATRSRASLGRHHCLRPCSCASQTSSLTAAANAAEPSVSTLTTLAPRSAKMAQAPATVALADVLYSTMLTPARGPTPGPVVPAILVLGPFSFSPSGQGFHNAFPFCQSSLRSPNAGGPRSSAVALFAKATGKQGKRGTSFANSTEQVCSLIFSEVLMSRGEHMASHARPRAESNASSSLPVNCRQRSTMDCVEVLDAPTTDVSSLSASTSKGWQTATRWPSFVA